MQVQSASEDAAFEAPRVVDVDGSSLQDAVLALASPGVQQHAIPKSLLRHVPREVELRLGCVLAVRSEESLAMFAEGDIKLSARLKKTL